MKAKELLEKLNACQESIKWVGERTIEQAWVECPRGDWMLWFYANRYPENKRQLTLAKGHCANTVRHLMKDKRSIAAVDAAIAYGNGLINDDELQKAASAASAAYAAYAAYAYAAAAAAAAANYASTASASAADSAAAAAYDYDVAYAYATAYAYAYATAAAVAAVAVAEKIENQKLTADICRQYLTLE